MSDLDENVPSRAPDGPLDDLFTSIIDPRSKDDTNAFPLDGINIDDVSNEKLARIVEDSPIIYQLGDNKVVRISRGLALKCGPSVLLSEARIMEVIRAKTAVVIPRIYRSFEVDDPSFQIH